MWNERKRVTGCQIVEIWQWERGRITKTWNDCTENDMREVSFFGKEMERNRDKWRNDIHGNRTTRANTKKWRLK